MGKTAFWRTIRKTCAACGIATAATIAWGAPSNPNLSDEARPTSSSTFELGENADVAWDSTPDAGKRKSFKINGVEFAFRYCSGGVWTLETEATLAMASALLEEKADEKPSSETSLAELAQGASVNGTAPFTVRVDEWRDFVNALNDKGILPDGMSFRLPTFDEWTNACLAGQTVPSLCAYAWFVGNSGGRAHNVGEKEPNAWGLYDTLGNVYEYCSDWYEARRPSDAVDPTGSRRGDERVVRGGSWQDEPSTCRSTLRKTAPPTGRYEVCGFRFVIARKR